MTDPLFLLYTLIGFGCYVAVTVYRSRHDGMTPRRALLVDMVLVIAAAEIVFDGLAHDILDVNSLWDYLSIACQGAIIAGGLVLFSTRSSNA